MMRAAWRACNVTRVKLHLQLDTCNVITCNVALGIRRVQAVPRDQKCLAELELLEEPIEDWWKAKSAAADEDYSGCVVSSTKLASYSCSVAAEGFRLCLCHDSFFFVDVALFGVVVAVVMVLH
jgi:hypothetical protein